MERKGFAWWRERVRAAGDGHRVSRRAALIGGGVAVVGAGVGLSLDALSGRHAPGTPAPRQAGAVDYAGARWVAASPANWRCADRPHDFPIDRVVIHVTQCSSRDAVKVFQDPAHQAASHYIVGKDGRITQMIRELDVAFHAGNRAYNNRSVGIEHEGWVDVAASFTEPMYQASARLTARVCRRYGIPVDRKHIIGHVEVPGADHTDPGPYWDWPRYIALVRRARAAHPGGERKGT